MDTLQKIITEETRNYVSTLSKGDDDWPAMETELMRRIKVRIMQANSNTQKGDGKLAMPRYLTFGQISEILNAVMTIRVIMDNDNEDTQLLGIYHDGVYDTNQNILFRIAIQLNETLTKRDLDEMVNRLMLICERANINKDKDLVAVNNGIFDYRQKKLLPFDESYVFLSKSEVDYDDQVRLKTFPDGWNVEDWLKEISVDDDVCSLLWETMGSIIRPYVKWDKSVWLFSTVGNNGKGTFCELLRNLLGPRAHASIPIADFAKQYALTNIIGKQAIIVDENDVGTYIDRVGIMKAVITGDIVTIDQKYKAPINYRFRGMMVQCLNEYPKVKDKSDSFYRRQIFVPFEKSFTGRENKNIKAVYLHDPEVLRYVLHKVLNMDYYELSVPQACADAMDDYKETNDPIRQFWNEFEDEFVWDLVPYAFLYDLYKVWYDQNYPRAQQVSRPAFINALKVIIQRESIVWTCDDDNRKKYRVASKMSKPELLIDQYKLANWMSKSYAGRDPKKKCTLVADDLAASYTGIIRK